MLMLKRLLILTTRIDMSFGLAFVLALCTLALASSTAFAADRDCSDFTYQEDAQSYFISRGGPSQDPDRLDADHDGQACDSLPHRGTSTPSTPTTPLPLDSDYDGVPDASDACPPTYGKLANGCPDADGDGVADDTDACRYEAGTQPNGCPAPPPRTRETMRRARILSVVDGDTVKVRLASGKRITVRLIGVDTPETTKPGTPVECGGKQATANMKRLALKRGRGRGVTLATDPTQDRTDRYGRLLAYARVDSGRDLAQEQIRAGWGMAYVYATPFERFASYDAAQGVAKGASRGAWGACGGSFHSAAQR